MTANTMSAPHNEFNCDYDRSIKKTQMQVVCSLNPVCTDCLMIIDLQYQLLSEDGVSAMTQTKQQGRSAGLLRCRYNYICLITWTQGTVGLDHGVIIYPHMERPIVRWLWIYALTGRRADLHSWPFSSCTCRGGWCLDSWTNNGRQRHWQRALQCKPARRQTRRLYGSYLRVSTSD